MRKAIVVLGVASILFAGCGVPNLLGPNRRGVAWGPGSFDSVGEQIYFTSVNAEGERISYRGGPSTGMMMQGYLSCASCHGPDGRGGRHVMHMEVMEAPDIRWSVLAGEDHEEGAHDGDDGHADEYNFETFRRAVIDGEHPDGDPLSRDMPRWRMGNESMEALVDYLRTLD